MLLSCFNLLVNLILLQSDDFLPGAPRRVRLEGRRADHVRSVHRAREGSRLIVGLAESQIGVATVVHLAETAVELEVDLHQAPPPALPLTLVLALPRPKVLNRVIAAAASLGIKRVFLINAWKVEKSYWKSPRLDPSNIRLQLELGLEQAKDTVLPRVELRRFFRQFVEDELPELSGGTLRLAAHPTGQRDCPRDVARATTLVVGPEGGFIDEEVGSLERCGFTTVRLGERILRVETAIAALVGRMF